MARVWLVCIGLVMLSGMAACSGEQPGSLVGSDAVADGRAGDLGSGTDTVLATVDVEVVDATAVDTRAVDATAVDATAVDASAVSTADVADVDASLIDATAAVQTDGTVSGAGDLTTDSADGLALKDLISGLEVEQSDGGGSGDVAAPDSATQDSQADAGPDATTTGCVATKELCDGVDNDCDGKTDEDFTLLTPMSAVALTIGQSCANPMCPKGTVVCHNLKYAWCDTCPTNTKPAAILAQKGAKKSPLVATGAMVDMSAKLPLKQLLIDVGAPLDVPSGSSGMAIDVDNDGDLDLVWVDGMHRVTLLTQTAPWQYSAKQIWKTDESIWSLAATDANGDGVPELLLGGENIIHLVRQKNGNYSDTSKEVGLRLSQTKDRVQHLAVADVNRDGLLDVVAGMFSCNAKSQALRVFINQGAGVYGERSAALGLGMFGSTWVTMPTDYNGDGLLDLVVLTESCAPNPGIALYLGQPYGKAGNSGVLYKLAQVDNVFTAPNGPVKGSPMGGAVADVNGDGVLDYVFGEIELHGATKMGIDPTKLDPLNPLVQTAVSNFYLLSQANGKRTNAGLEAGLWAPLSKSKRTMVAWSAVWADLDHDGHLDLLLAHGYEYGSWLTQDQGGMRPVAFRHNGLGHFSDVSATWGLPTQHAGRSLIAADLDGDGDLDLMMGGQATAPRVYRNTIQHGGSDVRVRLRGQLSNRWGLGARVWLHTDQRKILAEMGATSPAQTMATPELHFALKPKEQAQKLVVNWPSGWTSTTPLTAKGALPSNGLLSVVEPKLVTLSARWSAGGAQPVTITAVDVGPDGKPVIGSQGCTIQMESGAPGGFSAATSCLGATCTRTWIAPGKPNGQVRFRIACAGKSWAIRPTVFF